MLLASQSSSTELAQRPFSEESDEECNGGSTKVKANG